MTESLERLAKYYVLLTQIRQSAHADLLANDNFYNNCGADYFEAKGKNVDNVKNYLRSRGKLLREVRDDVDDWLRELKDDLYQAAHSLPTPPMKPTD